MSDDLLHPRGIKTYILRVLSLLGRVCFTVFFPTPNVRDFTSGYRAYRAETLKRAFAIYSQDFVAQSGFSCMVDILLKLRRMDAIMAEVPLVLRYDMKVGESKMLVVRTVADTLHLLITSRFKVR